MQSQEHLERSRMLAETPIMKLLVRFAIPSIIGMLVGALYNIVDQIFIGWGVGRNGISATGFAMPLTTIAASIALLFGIGGASRFNLALGQGEKDKGAYIIGNVLTMMILTGIMAAVLLGLFLNPLLAGLNTPPNVYPYAYTYMRIVIFGIPFLVLSTGISQLIRADGNPTYSMLCLVVGALLNTALDPLFIFRFNMGMAGAAYATVISQMVSGLMALCYMRHFKSVKLCKEHLKLKANYVKSVVSLGMAPSFNQFAMLSVQVTMLNVLTHYGDKSHYGSEVTTAVASIVTKVNIILISIMLGIAQGNQPIISFNYGAKNYTRVKQAYRLAVSAAIIVGILGFIIFQLFPRSIITIFSPDEDELFYVFAERYFRIFMAMVIVIGAQIVSSNMFTAIGKPAIGLFLSMTRQFLFLLPLIIIFPMLMGIDGIMYAAPIADAASIIVTTFFVIREFRRMGSGSTQAKG